MKASTPAVYIVSPIAVHINVFIAVFTAQIVLPNESRLNKAERV